MNKSTGKTILITVLAVAICVNICLAAQYLFGKREQGTPSQAHTGGPQSTVTVIEEESYSDFYGKTLYVNHRTAYHNAPSDTEDTRIGSLNLHDTVTYWYEDGDFTLVTLPDGKYQGWVESWYLSSTDAEIQTARDNAYLDRMVASAGLELLPEPQTYTVTAPVLHCYLKADDTGKLVERVQGQSEITVIGSLGNYLLCRLQSGAYVYCYEDEAVAGTDFVVSDTFKDLRLYIPGAKFDILNASTRNPTGEPLYPAIPLLESSTAEKLRQAAEIFSRDGYSIKIYDAYRPKSAQAAIYAEVGDTRYVANPDSGRSWHNLGAAVDMGLINNATGEELEMPAAMHTFATVSHRSSRGTWSKEVQANVDYMTKVMKECGFSTISTEWWHFQNEAAKTPMPEELDYTSLQYTSKEPK